MSKDQLVEAYVKGQISRRVFVRGLLAGGISLTSALAFARVLTHSESAPTQDRRFGATSLHDPQDLHQPHEPHIPHIPHIPHSPHSPHSPHIPHHVANPEP